MFTDMPGGSGLSDTINAPPAPDDHLHGIALALSLSEGMHRNLIVSITYIIVLFSILVQGLSLEKLVKKLHYGEDNGDVVLPQKSAEK